jgi:predicted nucleic acid-binding protein
MGRVRASSGRSRLILDAGALIALAAGDRRARAALAQALDERLLVQVPTPVLAQVHRGDHDHARSDRVLREIDEFVPTTEQMARSAGELLGNAGLADAIDAIVAAEALSGTPAAILTSDPEDITTLVEAGGGRARVSVQEI